MPTIEDAIRLALDAHSGQTDRAGQPYILHPLRLMAEMTDEAARIVAILHDVIEDTPITLDDLRARGYDETVVGAVDALSRREGETYRDFVQRIKPNPLARRVKLADLRDNMDIRRNPPLGDADLERLKRYQDAWWELTGE